MQSNVQTIEEVKNYDELYINFKWEIPKYYNFGFNLIREFKLKYNAEDF